MRALLMPAVVAAVQITSPSHHDADQMRESFYSLAAAKEQNGGKLDDATKVEVGKILDLVENTLIAALWTDRDATQAAYNASVKAVNDCNAQLVDTRLPVYESEKTTTTRVHTGFTDCLDLENEICGYKKGNCTALDEYVCGWSTDVCPDGPLDDPVCSECKTIDPTTTQLYEAATCLVDFHAKYYDTYITMDTKCNTLKGQLRHKVQECDGLQGSFEWQKCTEQNKINGFCNEHDQCWTSTTGALAEQETTAKNLEAIFQKQWTALQCLLCYGDQILQDKTDLTVCENAARPTFECCVGETRQLTPHVGLAICYYEHDTKYDCEGEKDANVPCTPGFFSTYYAAYDDTCAAVDECKSPCD